MKIKTISNNQYPGREKQYPISNFQYPISKCSSLAIGYSSSSYLDIGDWVLDIGYSSFSYLDIGDWVLDIGYSSYSEKQYPISKVQKGTINDK